MNYKSNKVNLRSIFSQVIVNSYCYFAPLSFIAIFLNLQLEIPAAKVALLMLIGAMTSRYSRLFFASIFDLIPVHILVSGLQIIGALGYFILSITKNPNCILISLILVGMFYGNSYTIIRVITVSLKSLKLESLNEKFALLHIATNVAAGIGPLILNIIYFKVSKQLVFSSTAIILIFYSIYSFYSMRGYTLTKQDSWFRSFFGLLLNKNLLPSYFLISLAWFFYVQMFTLAPALIVKKYHLTAMVWTVSFTNSVIVIIFSIFINKLLSRVKNDYISINIGLSLSAIGISLLLFINSLAGLLLGVVFISLAEIIFIPTFQVIHGKSVNEKNRVAIYTINSMFMGVGEGLGYYFGVVAGLNQGQVNIIPNIIIYIVLIIGIYVSWKISRKL